MIDQGINPSDCFFRRSQAGLSSGSGAGFEGAKSILADEGLRGLYTGYSSNIAYAFPADAIKFLVSLVDVPHVGCRTCRDVGDSCGLGVRLLIPTLA